MALGVILTPYGAHSPHGWYAEIAQARGGQGQYLPQPSGFPRLDRFFSTRGEVGFYYDTQLGNGLGDMIPTDAELAINTSCYTPLHSGWINTPQGYLPTPWRFGWNPAGAWGPQKSLSGLGQDASATDVIAAMNAHNKRVFMLSLVSTAAVSISALFALYRTKRLLKYELGKLKRKKKA